MKIIKPKELPNHINNSDIIIDLRTHGYYIMDHIKDAINLPYDIPKIYQKIEMIASENSDKKVILYCHQGHTAYKIASQLSELDNIYIIQGSFAQIAKSGIEIYYYK